MALYVFFSEQLDGKALARARRAAKALGVTVVRAVAGTMLVEATPAQISQVAKALPGWRYSTETKTHHIPERSPLQRAKAAAKN